MFSFEIQSEYERWANEVGEERYASPHCLGIHEVLRAHYLIMEFFNEFEGGIGGIGPRSLDLLHSCMYRQHASFGGVSFLDSKFAICATLFFGLIRDHPFHDANKRTALLCLLHHLSKIGYVPKFSQKQLEDFAVLVADRKLSKYSRYNELKKKKIMNAEVEFIAHHLQRNTRKLDKKYYIVTYRQLNNILKSFGYSLENPNKNFIDIVRVEEKRRIFGIAGPKQQTNVKVGVIKFPSWTSQVQKNVIEKVRRAADLTPEKGVDSATFFGREDPINCLIARYQKPLVALASR